jgi:hypothetical protein
MIALIILVVASMAVVALLVLKHIELNTGEIKLAAKYRTVADERILSVESKCRELCTIAQLKYMLLKTYNTLAHKFAKITASIAKKVEWRARSVAHKSAKAGAEVQAVRENGYLKDVQEHKESLDTARVAEENKL